MFARMRDDVSSRGLENLIQELPHHKFKNVILHLHNRHVCVYL